MAIKDADSDSNSNSVSAAELSRHNRESDLWIAVDGKVYDMTEFAPQHPGGSSIITKFAGQDASEAYGEIHAPSLISRTLPASKHKGSISAAALSQLPKAASNSSPASVQQQQKTERPPLQSLINLFDFEEVAQRSFNAKTWAFYSGAANDCITRDANRSWYEKIWLRPRLLRDVAKVSMKARIMGCDVEMPILVSPAALAKLSHPEGELAIARGAVKKGVAMCVSTNASYPFNEIAATTSTSHPFFFQLYVNKDRRKTEDMIREVVAAGYKAIVITVDLPVVGKREADERIKTPTTVAAGQSGITPSSDQKGAGLARSTGSFIDATFSWKDIAWIKSLTDLPIVLKGIQTAADAKKAMEYGCKGVFISNHGGRAMDSSSPAILVLLELHVMCPEIFDRVEIWVDGGVRRGTDILKALCLGATGVGLGRSFMYAVAYGQEGVEHAIDILKDELETAMQQCGLTNLSDASPEYLNTAEIDHLVRRGTFHPYARSIARPKL